MDRSKSFSIMGRSKSFSIIKLYEQIIKKLNLINNYFEIFLRYFLNDSEILFNNFQRLFKLFNGRRPPPPPFVVFSATQQLFRLLLKSLKKHFKFIKQPLKVIKQYFRIIKKVFQTYFKIIV